MRLIAAATSPFSRKVRAAAVEAGVEAQLRLELVKFTPLAPVASVTANPLSKVPILILDDGQALYDSRVIVAHFAALAPARGLYPQDRAKLLACLRREALADGIADAAVLLRYETHLRPAPMRWSAWMDVQTSKITAALNALELEARDLEAEPCVGEIAIACALSYLDLRFPAEPWRDGRANLSSWHAEFLGRPSMRATAYS